MAMCAKAFWRETLRSQARRVSSICHLRLLLDSRYISSHQDKNDNDDEDDDDAEPTAGIITPAA